MPSQGHWKRQKHTFEFDFGASPSSTRHHHDLPEQFCKTTVGPRHFAVQLAHSLWLFESISFLFHGTVRQNFTLNVLGRTLDESHALTLIHRLKMNDCLGDSPLDFQLFEGGSNLSGGQRQRLALIRALIYKRPVLILTKPQVPSIPTCETRFFRF